MKFVHVSDTQCVDEGQYKNYWGPAVNKIADTYPGISFLLESGDLVDTKDGEDQWRWFFGAAQEVFGNYGFVPVVGNHEQTAKYDADAFRRFFSVPNALTDPAVTPGTVYSFDYGQAHFIVLNSEIKTQAGITSIRKWLKTDLENNQKPWTIASFHRRPYGMGGAQVDTYNAFVEGLLMDYGCDLILHGHDHIYMRSYPTDDGGPAAHGLIALETGVSGFKQDSIPGSGRYVDVSTAVGKPSYSVITVSAEKIGVESVYVDNVTTVPEVKPILAGGEPVDFEITRPVTTVAAMLGIPLELCTPIFAIARTMGWCAHRIEEMLTGGRIIRPAYRSVSGAAPYVPLTKRV